MPIVDLEMDSSARLRQKQLVAERTVVVVIGPLVNVRKGEGIAPRCKLVDVIRAV